MHRQQFFFSRWNCLSLSFHCDLMHETWICIPRMCQEYDREMKSPFDTICQSVSYVNLLPSLLCCACESLSVPVPSRCLFRSKTIIHIDFRISVTQPYPHRILLASVFFSTLIQKVFFSFVVYHLDRTEKKNCKKTHAVATRTTRARASKTTFLPSHAIRCARNGWIVLWLSYDRQFLLNIYRWH